MNKTAVIIVVALLAMVTLGRTFLVAAPCPSTKVVAIPEWADPNLINYELMGVIDDVVEGMQSIKRVWACDENGDELVFSFLQAPAGMLLVRTDPNEADVVWTPASVGVYYMDLKVVDIPKAEQPQGEDVASVIYRVHETNKPPIFGGCG